MTRPSGRERVSEFLDSYYSINPGLPHHHDELGASIAADLDALTAARKAAEKFHCGDYGDDLAEFATDVMRVLGGKAGA